VALAPGAMAVALAGALLLLVDAVVLAGVGAVGVIVMVALSSDIIIVVVSLTKSSADLQAEISLAEGMAMVCKATTWFSSMVTGIALGPDPRRQAMVILGLDCIPPNLVQL
jgi:hypothetical protein